MSASPVRPPGGRPPLGSPVIPINPSASYLRHRAATERTRRARRRAICWRRLLLALVCVGGYFAIGRDLMALALAKKDVMAMEVRHEVQTLNADLDRIAEASRLLSASEVASPLAFTSAAALADKGDPDEIDAWLCDEPVEIHSRAE